MHTLLQDLKFSYRLRACPATRDWTRRAVASCLAEVRRGRVAKAG